MKDSEFGLSSTFGISDLGNPVASKICLWSPHPKVDFVFPVFEDARDAIRVCVNDSEKCQKPFSMKAEGQGTIELTPAEYIEIDADNQRFSEQYNVIVRGRGLGKFFDSADNLDGKRFELIKLAKREERKEGVEGPRPQVQAAVGERAPVVEQRRVERGDNTVQVASIFTGGIVVIVLILFYAGTHPPRRRNLEEDAEARLLPRSQPQFPQYPQYQMPYGQPFYQQPLIYPGFPMATVPQ
jgi:hypothetical protein